jgi:hypothetical protein
MEFGRPICSDASQLRERHLDDRSRWDLSILFWMSEIGRKFLHDGLAAAVDQYESGVSELIRGKMICRGDLPPSGAREVAPAVVDHEYHGAIWLALRFSGPAAIANGMAAVVDLFSPNEVRMRRVRRA